MLLALLAMALPTAALAGTITFETGTFMSGTITSTFRNPFTLQVVGDMNTITLDTSSLAVDGTHCTPTAPLCSFTSGTITVTHAGTPIFTSSLMNGTLSHTIVAGTLDLVSITGFLTTSATVLSGSAVSFTAFINLVHGGSLISPSTATVLIVSPIPEPGTLGLLGTGLIGLAGLVRLKLKFGR
jgi:hypothetical protein